MRFYYMITLNQKLSEIHTDLSELIKLLESEKEMLDAYLYTSRVRCGRENCHCMTSDDRHESLCLSYREEGRSKTRSIPSDTADQLQIMTDSYKKCRKSKKSIQTKLDDLFKRIEAGMNRSTKRGRKQLETILKERKKTK